MERLLQGEVVPANEDDISLPNDRIDELLEELDHDWKVVDYHELEKTFDFDDFVSAMAFVNRVGEYAEQVNHHPEITFTWGKATINIYTHDVDGLREEDFFWAASVEKLYERM